MKQKKGKITFPYCIVATDRNRTSLGRLMRPMRYLTSPLLYIKKTLRLYVLLRTFWRIIVSLLIHFLLRSIPQWRFFRWTTPWDNSYSLITQLSSRMPSQLILARLEVFGKNLGRLAVFLGNELLITM